MFSVLFSLSVCAQQDDLRAGEEIARCPSCSLYITVIYNPEDFQEPPPDAPKATLPATPAPVPVQ